MRKNFYKNYFQIFKNTITFSDENLRKIGEIEKLILKVKKEKKKILIFGNGGSAAIASHFSIDCNNKLKIKCLNFNEASILTCFSNDYGYENWVKKALEQFSEKGDLVILISSSGMYHNVLKIRPPMVFNKLNADLLLKVLNEILEDTFCKRISFTN